MATTQEEQPAIFEDITELIRQASQQLTNSSPMAYSPEFSLYDSMSAVEIMDPKMDPCHDVKGQKFDEMIAGRFTNNLTSHNILTIFRELFIREVAYLDGASLLESLNQCIYIWPQSWKLLNDQNDIPSKVLLFYVKGIVASLEPVHQSILTADIFEDEDYQASSIISAVFDENTLLQIIASMKTVLNDDSGVYHNQVGDEIIALYQFRLTYLNLMKIIQSSIRECILSSKKSSSTNVKGEMTPFVENLKHSLIEILKLSNELLQILSNLQTIFSLSTSASASSSNSESDNDLELIQRSFTVDILKIHQNTPSRFFPYLSYDHAIGFFQSIIRQIIILSQDLENILSLSSHDLSHDYLLTYFISLSSLASRYPSGPGTCCSSKGSTSILPRSFLWGCIHSIKLFMSQTILNSMISRGFPQPLLQFELCEQWRDIVGNLVWDTLRILCINRYRLTSRLELLFERYGSMVADGFMLDRTAEGILINDIFSKDQKIEWFLAWSIHLTSGIMDLYMELLMEMDLLSYSEMSSFYWYWDYLISTKSWSVRTMREMKDTHELITYRRNQKEAEEIIDTYEFQQLHQKSKTNKKGKQSKQSNQQQGSTGTEKEIIDKATMKEAKKTLQLRPPEKNPLDAEEILLTARSQMAKGLLRVYLSAVEDHLISNTSDQKNTPSYYNPELQFQTRYHFFQMIASPTPLQYSQYLTLVQTVKGLQRNSRELLETSVKCFKSIKELMERATEVAEANQNQSQGRIDHKKTRIEKEKLELQMCGSLVKVSVTLSISCMRRLQSLDKLSSSSSSGDSHWNLSLDRTHSLCFPILIATPR